MINIQEGGYVITFPMIEKLVNDINTCNKNKGMNFEIPSINVPGLGNVIYNKLLLIDAGLTASYKPVLELKKIYDNYIKPSINNPTKLAAALQKLAEYVNSIKDLLNNPIEFIIKEIVKPIKNLLLPLSIDFSKYIPGLNIDLSEGFNKLSDKEKEKLKGLNSPAWLKNISEFLMLPINMIIGLFKKIVEMIKNAVDPTKAIIELPKMFIKLLTNFYDTIIEIITDLMESIMEPLITMILPDPNFPELNLALKSMFSDIFNKLPFDRIKYNSLSPDFSKIFYFISLIGCFMNSFLSILTDFPKLAF